MRTAVTFILLHFREFLFRKRCKFFVVGTESHFVVEPIRTGLNSFGIVFPELIWLHAESNHSEIFVIYTEELQDRQRRFSSAERFKNINAEQGTVSENP